MRRNRLLLVMWTLVALVIGFMAGRSRISVEKGEIAEAEPTEVQPIKETDISLPTPVALHKVTPEYPETARKAGIQGTVFIKAFVDTAGCVADAEVFRSVHPALDSAAVGAAKQWRFSPSRCLNRPVPQYVFIPVEFALE
jgi:TonB family protein